jgi:hypothetical protein
MLELLRFLRSSIVFIAFACSECSALDVKSDPLNEYRSRDDIHGLYEIREVARKFVIAGNVRNSTHWMVMDPNLKIQVTLCAVPLEVVWVPKSYGLSNTSVEVVCSRTINPKIEKKWRVFVPVFQETSPQK